MAKRHNLPPLSEAKLLEVRKMIADYWNGIAICDAMSGTLRELLRDEEIKVTDLLTKGRAPDIYDAWRITVRAERIREELSHE